MSADNWLRSLPKTELHIHLEGAIPLPALLELVRKYGGLREAPDLGALEERFRYKDFPGFIRTWVWKNDFLREYDDFTFISEAVARDLAEQNVRYAELFFSPGDFARHGLEPGELTRAVRKGLDAHSGRIKTRLVADLIRDFGPEKGMRWLKELAEVRELGVIGIGIGGSEHEFPPEPYAGVYEAARGLGFRTSAHAGEAAGPASVWGAVKVLKADRIGHGTRAAEDPALVEYLRARRIPVEMCPVSNLRTGVCASLKSHPVAEFYRKGLLVSVNTDDPKMFNTSLEGEYAALMSEAGLGRADILKLAENAVRSAWCVEGERDALLAELREFGAAG